MKPLLLMLLISVKCFGQNSDLEIQRRVSALEGQMSKNQDNLLMCHQEFKIGSATFLVGCAALACAIPNQNTNTRLVIALGGGLLQFVGGLIMIDSHKYIGRAGSLEISGTGVQWNFTDPEKRNNQKHR